MAHCRLGLTKGLHDEMARVDSPQRLRQLLGLLLFWRGGWQCIRKCTSILKVMCLLCTTYPATPSRETHGSGSRQPTLLTPKAKQ